MSHAGWLVPKLSTSACPTTSICPRIMKPRFIQLGKSSTPICKDTGADVHQWSSSSWCPCHCRLSSAPGSAHGDVATLPREDEHPSCTIKSISSSCSSAFLPQLPLSCIDLGGSYHPQNGGTTPLCPGKGIPHGPGVSV